MTKLSGAAHAHSGIDTRSSVPAGDSPVFSLPLFDRYDSAPEPAVPPPSGFPVVGSTSIRFNGDTYSPEYDLARLTGQIARVFELMKDGHWRTLGEIEAETGAPQASASAQLRHLRKPRFGSHTVEKRPQGDGRPDRRAGIPSGARMTIAQVADALGVSRDFIENRLQEFKAEKRGRRYFIPDFSVETWRAAQRVGVPNPALTHFRRNGPLARVERLAFANEIKRRALR